MEAQPNRSPRVVNDAPLPAFVDLSAPLGLSQPQPSSKDVDVHSEHPSSSHQEGLGLGTVEDDSPADFLAYQRGSHKRLLALLSNQDRFLKEAMVTVKFNQEVAEKPKGRKKPTPTARPPALQKKEPRATPRDEEEAPKKSKRKERTLPPVDEVGRVGMPRWIHKILEVGLQQLKPLYKKTKGGAKRSTKDPLDVSKNGLGGS